MKLVIAGANGYVGTELVRQSLRLPAITTVIALARRPVEPPAILDPGADVSKLKHIIVEAYDKYSDEVREQFATADACIWTVAITPSKSSLYSWDDVRRVCYESPIAGFQAMLEARSSAENTTRSSSFRFLYMSGAKSERDQTKRPSFRPEYCLLRGETETAILKLAQEYGTQAEACVVKPGLIVAPNDVFKTALGFALKWLASLPSVGLSEISAAMLGQSVNGFEKDTLENSDLVRLGREGEVRRL